MLMIGACGSQESSKDKSELYDDKDIIPIEQDANDVLMAEVLEIHDEVMPEMGSIRRTRKALLDKLETSTDEALNKVLQEQADQLDESHEAMMAWMRQFKPDTAITGDKMTEYLEDQKLKMIEVRDLMVNSLKEGKALLGAED